MNLPNLLTLLRVFLTVVILLLVFRPGLGAKITTMVIFVAAALSDWLDGYLARRLKQITRMGMFWDPLADKALVLGVLWALARLGLVPMWMVGVIFVREVLVTVLRMRAVRRGVVIPAAKEGKQKAAAQMLAIVLLLSHLIILEWRPSAARDALTAWLPVLGLCALAIAVALTVWSGARFVWTNRGILFGAPPSRS